MAYYGKSGRLDEETVPDWVMGGERRRRILERLAEQGDGWRADELVTDLGVGRAWVFEVYRALKATGALEQVADGRYRLAADHALGGALTQLLSALKPLADTPVSRPPGR